MEEFKRDPRGDVRERLRVEQITEQGEGKMNEDTMLTGARRFGVFDGSTGLDGYVDAAGRTGGYLASHLAEEVFREESRPLAEAVEEANKKIASAMEKEGTDTSRKENRWASGFAVVDVDLEAKEFHWTQIMDALILVIYKDGSHKMLVRGDYNHDRNLLTRWKELVDAGATDAGEIRRRLWDETIALRRTQSIGYGALNGEPEALRFVQTGRESLENVAHILVFTDGLMIPKENPRAEDDFNTMTRVFLERGFEGLKRYVRELEESDPQCVRYIRYKRHDDVAAVAISFRITKEDSGERHAGRKKRRALA